MAKIIKGKVIKLCALKTAVITIETRRAHPLYKKVLKKNIKLKAHYENIVLKLGDLVNIKEVRPFSKTKNWLVINKSELK